MVLITAQIIQIVFNKIKFKTKFIKAPNHKIFALCLILPKPANMLNKIAFKIFKNTNKPPICNNSPENTNFFQNKTKAINGPNTNKKLHHKIPKTQKYFKNIFIIIESFHFSFFSISSVVTGNRKPNKGPNKML